MIHIRIIWSLILANAILERKPSLLTPSGGQTYTHIVKGEELLLECIAEGL